MDGDEEPGREETNSDDDSAETTGLLEEDFPQMLCHTLALDVLVVQNSQFFRDEARKRMTHPDQGFSVS